MAGRDLHQRVVAHQHRGLREEILRILRLQLPREADSFVETVLGDRGIALRPKPLFGHGLVYHPTGGPVVIASYHPSRQNTNTGKLTAKMLGDVFKEVRRVLKVQEVQKVR